MKEAAWLNNWFSGAVDAMYLQRTEVTPCWMLLHIWYCTWSPYLHCMLVHIGYCTWSPYVHCMPWLAQYDRWDFLRDKVGFVELDKICTIFYLFVSGVKSRYLSSQSSTNCCNFLLTLEINHTLETNIHFTSELLICTLGDLTISNLTYAARLLDCERPTLMARMKISYISLFFILG